jgi:anaerobic magnesium-protoporphyrin IX monomethyl ester cyclase
MVQAVLKEQGFRQTRLLDANIQAYWHLLDVPRLGAAREAVERRLGELESLPYLNPAQASEYYELARAAVSAPYVIGNLEDALDVLRDWKRFVVFKQYAWAIRVLERALMLASAPYYPTRFVFDYKMRFSTKSTVEVEQALSDPRNLFLSFYSGDLVPRLLAEAPELAVIAISLRSQLIPALTLARVLKSAQPGIHISVSGVFLHYQQATVRKWARLFDFVDSVILGAFRQYEGGFAEVGVVAELARALARGGSLDNVAGLLYRDSRSVRQVPGAAPADIETLPTPDFDGVADEKYLAPEIVYPLAITKGCYWGRCAFCTRTEPYAQRSAETVLRDMQSLRRRYGARCFYFTDDAIRPELLASLSAGLTQALPDSFWHSMMRFDRALDREACLLMRRSGCRCLEFGLESASARLLKLTRKGTTLEIIRNVLSHCSAAGIEPRVFCIVGFPGETENEIAETVRFLKECSDIIRSVRIVRFMLEPGSYMEAKPAEFGLIQVIGEPDRDLAANLLYQVSAGAGMQDAVRMQAAAIEEIDAVYGGRLAFQTFRQHAFLHAVAGAGGQDTGAVHLTPETLLESVLEPAAPEGLRRFRYCLETLARCAAESRIRRKQAILAGSTHSVQDFADAGPLLYPEAKPPAYLYTGEKDAIRELPDSMLRFLNMLEPDLTLGQALRRRNVAPHGRVLDAARALLDAGILRVRHKARVEG